MYVEKWKVIEHQRNIIQCLVKDMRKAKKECDEKKKEIVDKISEIPCTLLDEKKMFLMLMRSSNNLSFS